MRAPGFLVLLLPSLAGCVDLDPGGPDAGDCRAGPGAFFVKVRLGGGFVPPTYLPTRISLDRDGDLFYFEATTPGGSDYQPAPGTGAIRAAPGTMRNLTVEAARTELERMGAWRGDVDYNVTRAFRGWIGWVALGRLCGVAVPEFYDIPATPSRHHCADDGSVEYTVSSRLGVHTAGASSADACDNAAPAFRAFDDAFFDVVEGMK